MFCPAAKLGTEVDLKLITADEVQGFARSVDEKRSEALQIASFEIFREIRLWCQNLALITSFH